MKNKPLAAVAMLVVLTALFVVAHQYERHRHSRIMAQQLKSKVSELDRRLTQLAVVPRLLAEHPDIETALAESSSAAADTANRVLRRAQLDSNAEFVFLLDHQGTTIAASNFGDDVSFVGRNYSFRPYFIGALDKLETTFFAVGATTGIPGYFVANPVLSDNLVIGVVVVKFELAGLLDAWAVVPYQWLATDELGVVILSTISEYLYVPTRTLLDEERGRVKAHRKYKLTEDTRIEVAGSEAYVSTATSQNAFFVQSRGATVEHWQLLLLLESSVVRFRAMLYVLACAALIAIIGLLYRNMRANQRLAASEKRYVVALEREVQLRTEELRSAQERLISESNFAMLGRMSAAINHEINQPLTSLRFDLATMRKLISGPDPDIDEVRQVVVETDRTTKRIGRVVTTLRNLTGGRRARQSELSLDSLVADVVDTIKRERPQVSACLTVSIDPDIRRISGNEVLLQQALLNLLYNAFDAVIEEADPHVELGVRQSGDRVALQIIDNGCGLSESIMQDLGKPFVTDESKKNGLGLGLTLVELIATDHGGELSYEAVENQSGSIFTLLLPIVGRR